MDNFLLDTHVWIWLQEADKQLPLPTVRMLESVQAERRLFASAISVLEIAQLEINGRIQLTSNIHAWLKESFADNGIQLLTLSPKIAVESTRLPGNLHRDPADRILAATARIEGMTLLTRDTRLLDYGRKGHLRTRRV
jgi:PIN domain nuclease of toxin-antitoxin system